MKKSEKMYDGTTFKTKCYACAREKGEMTLGNIAKSKYFDAHQDFGVPIPGFIVISSRRHIQGVEDFTAEEQKDFMKFLVKVRSAMRKGLGIKQINIYQDEATRHKHFHMWFFPRYSWMKKFGTKIESVRPIIEYAKKEMTSKKDILKVEKGIEKIKNSL